MPFGTVELIHDFIAQDAHLRISPVKERRHARNRRVLTDLKHAFRLAWISLGIYAGVQWRSRSKL
jgi:hypothetical protein